MQVDIRNRTKNPTPSVVGNPTPSEKTSDPATLAVCIDLFRKRGARLPGPGC